MFYTPMNCIDEVCTTNQPPPPEEVFLGWDEAMTKIQEIRNEAEQLCNSLCDSKKQPELQIVELAVRSLLLCGAGRGYEPTYAYAIRCYLRAWKEVHSLESGRFQIEESDRLHFLASWKRELRDRSESLKLLDVQVIATKCGQPIDPDVHHVTQTRATRDVDLVDTIAEVHGPAFRFLNDIGREKVEPAEVVAYVEDRSLDDAE